MTDEQPETVEETKARLARYAASPYHPEPDDDATPYALAPAKGPRRSPRIALVVVAILALAGVGAGIFFAAGATNWSAYPGSADRDDADVLAGPSLEAVVADSEAMLKEYRDALTEKYGMTWTEVIPDSEVHDFNGYGGDSMLYSYSSSYWQGEVVVDDPGARQVIQDTFATVTGDHGGGDLVVWNDLLTDDTKYNKQAFGAAAKPDQAYWQLTNSVGDPLTGLYVASDVFDQNLPTDPSFSGANTFQAPEHDNSLVVTVDASARALLSEKDRAAYQKAIEPYAGKTRPSAK